MTPGFPDLNVTVSCYFFQGIMHESRPIFTAQFHPEAWGGPTDTEVRILGCHDAIITNEINLFGLARVEDLSSSLQSHHDTGRSPEHFSRYRGNLWFRELNKLFENMQ